MDLLSLLQSGLDLNSLIGTFSKELDADEKKVSKATNMILPMMLMGMSKNVQSKNGLASLFDALDDHKDNDLSDSGSFFDKLDLSDGKKILGHLFGGETKSIEKEVAKESGLKQADTGKLMAMIAPILMAVLGNKKKSQKGFDSSSLLTMVMGLAGTKSSASKSTGKTTSKTASKSTGKTTSKTDNKTSTGKKVTSVSSSKKTAKATNEDALSDVVDLIGNLLKNK